MVGAVKIIRTIWRFRTLVVMAVCVGAIMWFKAASRKELEKLNKQHEQQIVNLKQQHATELKIVKEAGEKYEKQLLELQQQHQVEVQQIIEQTPQTAQKFLATYRGKDNALWEEFAKQYELQIIK